MTGFVYRWTNEINGKHYVGSHRGTTDDGYRHSSKVMKKVELKYGVENLVRDIIYVGNHYRELESFILREADAANNPHYYNQSNSVWDANDKGIVPWNKGKKGISAETSAKMSRARMGHTVTPETRAKIAKAATGNTHFKGKQHSEESKQLMSSNRKGIVFSDEHKANLSKARRAYLKEQA